MEINGLPLHPLVVHAAVVFGTLGALAGLAYAVVPARRELTRWPMLGLAVMAGLSIVAAYFTGNDFLDSRPELRQLPLVHTHEQRGERLLWVTIAFTPAALVAGWLHARTGVVAVLVSTVLGTLALGVLVLVVLTGEAGARAVWGQ